MPFKNSLQRLNRNCTRVCSKATSCSSIY